MDRFRRKSCCGQNLYELTQGTVPHLRQQLVAKVRENPSIEAMLPSIDGGGFQRPPSTRRERLHPPFGLLPKCSTGNWDLVKPVLGTNICSLDVFTQSQARYPLCRTQAERNRSTLPLPTGDVHPKAAVRRRSWIPLAQLMSLVHVAPLSRSV